MSWGGGLGHLRGAATMDVRPFSMDTFKRLLGFVRPYRHHLYWALAAALASTGLTLIGPWLLSAAIDRGILAKHPSALIWTALAYLATRLAATGLSAVQIMSVARLGNGAVYDLRKVLFSRILRLGFRFFDQTPVGVVVSRGTNDVTALSNLVSSGIVSITADAVTLAGIIVVMLVWSPKLALAAFATLPVLVAVTLLFQHRAIRAYRSVRTAIGRLTADFEESLSGMRVTQAFTRGPVNARRFLETNQANVEANMDAAVVNTLFSPVVTIIGTAGTVAVLWYGGHLGLAGVVSIGTLVAFTNYLSRFFQPIQDLTQQYNAVQQAMAAAEKLFHVIDEPVEVADRADAGPTPPLSGHVRFRHVSFGYDPDRPVVHDLDFELPAGQRVALVGPTGAGKTTTAALLLRFYDPTEGSVEVDGHDLRGFLQDSYRQQVAVVLQDPVVFSATVADNIRYGRLDATDAQVAEAAGAVGALPFIKSLPHGFDTQVGERGTRLSQGQKQLLSFARALLADPRILVLDEATASVDSQTESIISEALRTLLADRTSLVIAHRLSTIRDADLILVLQDGRVVEQGKHRDLVAAGGLYAALHARQFGEQQPA